MQTINLWILLLKLLLNFQLLMEQLHVVKL